MTTNQYHEELRLRLLAHEEAGPVNNTYDAFMSWMIRKERLRRLQFVTTLRVIEELRQECESK
jgi:hypothetical protein